MKFHQISVGDILLALNRSQSLYKFDVAHVEGNLLSIKVDYCLKFNRYPILYRLTHPIFIYSYT